jgi:hypothetical protein
MAVAVIPVAMAAFWLDWCRNRSWRWRYNRRRCCFSWCSFLADSLVGSNQCAD